MESHISLSLLAHSKKLRFKAQTPKQSTSQLTKPEHSQGRFGDFKEQPPAEKHHPLAPLEPAP